MYDEAKEHRGAAGHAVNTAPVAVVDTRDGEIEKQSTSKPIRQSVVHKSRLKPACSVKVALTTCRQTPTRPQRTGYRPHSADNARHATAVGTVVTLDIVLADYPRLCCCPPLSSTSSTLTSIHHDQFSSEVRVYDEATIRSTERRRARRQLRTSCGGRYS